MVNKPPTPPATYLNCTRKTMGEWTYQLPSGGALAWWLWAARGLCYRLAERPPSCFLSTRRNFSVEMYFRNESNKAPWPLSLPGCPQRCPLQDFLHLTEPVVPKDWQQECKLASGPADTGELLPASVLVMSEHNCSVLCTGLESWHTLPAISTCPWTVHLPTLSPSYTSLPFTLR